MCKPQTLVLIATMMCLSQAAEVPERVSPRHRSPRDRYGADPHKLQQRIDLLRAEIKTFETPVRPSSRSKYLAKLVELRDLLTLKIEQQPKPEDAELCPAAITCREGHELTPMRHKRRSAFIGRGTECDACGKEASCGGLLGHGDVMMHCEKCDYDLCQACHEDLSRHALEAAEQAREEERVKALSDDQRELMAVEALITQLHFSRSRGRLGHIAMNEESSDVESGYSSSTDESALNSSHQK